MNEYRFHWFYGDRLMSQGFKVHAENERQGYPKANAMLANESPEMVSGSRLILDRPGCQCRKHIMRGCPLCDFTAQRDSQHE